METRTIILILVIQTTSSTRTPDNDFNILRDLYSSMSSTFQNYAERLIQPPDWNYWTQPSNEGLSPPSGSGHQYDFIIVGSGSAGSVIANRLSEVSNWKILLLEAGKGENIVSRIPLIAPVMQFTHYDWHYLMERQENICLGLEGQRMYWPRGRALGGTSVINYMIYTRGNPLDYDRWETAGNPELNYGRWHTYNDINYMIYTRGNPLDYDRWETAGNPGWSYRDVLPYFLKSERANLKLGDYRYHNRNGYQSVEDVYQSPLVKAFIRAGNELGLPTIDYNSPEQPFGVSTIQATVLKGQRHSVARAFLDPIKHRSNLHMFTSAFVTKILIDPSTRQAYGVEYERNGKKYTARATKEVILSAGTFNSPQLLMLSGIGPKQHLEELNIPVLEDLPVGQNLHDHIAYPALSYTITKGTSISPLTVLTLQNILDYQIKGTGPISSLSGVEGIGYIKTEVSNETANIPDIELFLTDGALNSDYGTITRRSINMKQEVYDALFRPYHNVPMWTVTPMLLHPRSVGYMKLKSRNPKDYPLLYGNFFSDPENHDMRTLIASIRYIQRMANTRAFREIGSKPIPGRMPGCKHLEYDSDDYWECAVRSIAITLHHQLGTAKMGPKNDKTAVVSNELKVHGVKRLRVADCSVIPFALSAHTNAPSIMIGEKAADMIKATWQNI